MSHQHFVRSLLKLNERCPNDHMRHFGSVSNSRVKKIIYYNRSYLMVVTMVDRKQKGVRIKVRAPYHDLAAEQGAIERSLGVKKFSHYADA